MRLFLFVPGIGVGIVCIGVRPEAQNYPWCAQYKGGAMNVVFTTFEQCLATVSEAGLCIQNNAYQQRPDCTRKRGAKDALLTSAIFALPLRAGIALGRIAASNL